MVANDWSGDGRQRTGIKINFRENYDELRQVHLASQSFLTLN
jgi:hypothetical protein